MTKAERAIKILECIEAHGPLPKEAKETAIKALEFVNLYLLYTDNHWPEMAVPMLNEELEKRGFYD